MLAREYIEKLIISGQRALEELDRGEKRKSIGSLDYVKDRTVAAISVLIAEIEDQEGKF